MAEFKQGFRAFNREVYPPKSFARFAGFIAALSLFDIATDLLVLAVMALF